MDTAAHKNPPGPGNILWHKWKVNILRNAQRIIQRKKMFAPLKQEAQSSACGPKQVLQDASHEWHWLFFPVIKIHSPNCERLTKITKSTAMSSNLSEASKRPLQPMVGGIQPRMLNNQKGSRMVVSCILALPNRRQKKTLKQRSIGASQLFGFLMKNTQYVLVNTTD